MENFKLFKKILVIALVWLIIVNIFALLALNRFNLYPDTAYTWIDPEKTEQRQSWNPLGLHAMWDSWFYIDIARDGYKYIGPEELSNIVFFPIYPLLIGLAAKVLLGNFLLAGWIVSSIFLIFSLYFLYKIVSEFFPKINSWHAVYFLLIFPTAFFLNAIYTESTFLFFSLGTFYFALKRNFLAAGIFGFLAALTRVTGILLVVPVALEYFQWRKDWKPDKNFFWLGLIPVGTFLFFLYHYYKFGDFLLFLKVESSWGRDFTLNTGHLQVLTNPAAVNMALDVFFVVLALLCAYFVYKRLSASFAVYMLLTVLVALSTGTLMSIGRFVLVLFPIYILLASIKNESAKQTIAFIFILLLAMNITLFVNFYWAG